MNTTTQVSFKQPDAPATNRQTWMLFTLTKTDWRGKGLTVKQASEKIAELLEAKKNGQTIVSNNNNSKPTVNYREIFNKAREAANSIDTKNEVFGGCGFAHVLIRDVRTGFAKWLKDNNYGYYSSYEKGMTISPEGAAGSTQSVNVKETWCNAFAKVLRENGILNVFVRSRLD